jgi:hypothetical protein
LTVMRPAARKAALRAHVTTSVGWLGAVVMFLVLAVTAWRSRDDVVVRAGYVAMDVGTRYAIVPLAVLVGADQAGADRGGDRTDLHGNDKRPGHQGPGRCRVLR